MSSPHVTFVTNKAGADDTGVMPPVDEFLSPDVSLCFDQLWVEPTAVARQNGQTPAEKVFIAVDTLGESFLCYLQTNR